MQTEISFQVVEHEVEELFSNINFFPAELKATSQYESGERERMGNERGFTQGRTRIEWQWD